MIEYRVQRGTRDQNKYQCTLMEKGPEGGKHHGGPTRYQPGIRHAGFFLIVAVGFCFFFRWWFLLLTLTLSHVSYDSETTW